MASFAFLISSRLSSSSSSSSTASAFFFIFSTVSWLEGGKKREEGTRTGKRRRDLNNDARHVIKALQNEPNESVDGRETKRREATPTHLRASHAAANVVLLLFFFFFSHFLLCRAFVVQLAIGGVHHIELHWPRYQCCPSVNKSLPIDGEMMDANQQQHVPLYQS